MHDSEVYQFSQQIHRFDRDLIKTAKPYELEVAQLQSDISSEICQRVEEGLPLPLTPDGIQQKNGWSRWGGKKQ